MKRHLVIVTVLFVIVGIAIIFGYLLHRVAMANVNIGVAYRLQTRQDVEAAGAGGVAGPGQGNVQAPVAC